MIVDNDIEKIGIDLMWVRPGKVGGTESYTRNLLKGFMKLDREFRFVLLCSKDNADSFREYLEDPRFEMIVASVPSCNISRRILWQNAHQNRFLKKNGIKKCFVPVYCKPWLTGGIEYTCVIHDIQAIHYPEYHPFHEVAYSKLCWHMDVKNAHRIIATTEYVKNDLIAHYGRNDIEVINIPILIEEGDEVDFTSLGQRYNVSNKGYFYIVAQLIPHKNVKTVVNVINKLVHDSKYENSTLPKKLIVTGINGNAAKELVEQIDKLGLKENIILSGFISNAERNTLYKNAYAFLFPSVFEGFGMPPLEALYLGCPVVTTKCTSIPEVTQGKAIYVDDPYNVEEWIEKMMIISRDKVDIDWSRYDEKYLALKYLDLFYEREA